MPVSLEKKLAGKEEEIVNTITESGSIDGTMLLYGVRSRHSFITWLRDNTEREWKVNPLSHLKGGVKHKWLRVNRETVLGCLEIFGRPWVEVTYHFTHDTLDRFLDSNGEPFLRKLTRLERVELDNRDLKARVAKLEKRIELYDIRFLIVDEGHRQIKMQQNEIAEQVDNFEADVASLATDKLKQHIQESLERRIAPVKPRLLQPPDLNINYLLEAKREAWEAKEAEERVRKEAKLAAKEKAKREAQEKAEEAKKAREARKAEVMAKKKAELATKEKEKAKRETEEATTKAQGEQQSFGENPLVTTIARLKEG